MKKFTIRARDIRHNKANVYSIIRQHIGDGLYDFKKSIPMWNSVPTGRTETKFYQLVCGGYKYYYREEHMTLLSKNLPHAWFTSQERFDELLSDHFVRINVTDNVEAGKLVIRATEFKCDPAWFKDLTAERSAQWVFREDDRGDFVWKWFNYPDELKAKQSDWEVRGRKYKLYGCPDSLEDWYRNLRKAKDRRVCKKCTLALEEHIPESAIKADVEITIDFKGVRKWESNLRHLNRCMFLAEKREELKEKYSDFQKKCAILKEKDPSVAIPRFSTFARPKFQNQYHLYFVSNGKLEETEKYYPFMERLNKALNGENARQHVYHGWGCSSSFHGPDSHNRHSAD